MRRFANCMRGQKNFSQVKVGKPRASRFLTVNSYSLSTSLDTYVFPQTTYPADILFLGIAWIG